MTETEAKQYKFKEGIKTVPDHIEKHNDDKEVKNALEKEVKGAEFNVWFKRELPKTEDKQDRNKRRYEAFVTGYLSFYENWVNTTVEHGIYFKWRGHEVTVFITPPAAAVTKPIHYSVDLEPEKSALMLDPVIDDAATATSDPPGTPTIPPPPM